MLPAAAAALPPNAAAAGSNFDGRRVPKLFIATATPLTTSILLRPWQRLDVVGGNATLRCGDNAAAAAVTAAGIVEQ